MRRRQDLKSDDETIDVDVKQGHRNMARRFAMEAEEPPIGIQWLNLEREKRACRLAFLGSRWRPIGRSPVGRNLRQGSLLCRHGTLTETKAARRAQVELP